MERATHRPGSPRRVPGRVPAGRDDGGDRPDRRRGHSRRGAKPAFLGYRGYPKSICVSVNEEVVHGIPSPKRVLKAGDIVGLDLGASSTATTATPPAPRFSSRSRMWSGSSSSRPTRRSGRASKRVRVGGRVGDIGAAVESVAKHKGYGVVREFVGHGIGTSLHEEPQVPNYGPAGRRETIREG